MPDIKGTVHHVGEIEVVSEKFQKRVLVIKYIENPNYPDYPEYVKFEAHQNDVHLLNPLEFGDECQVSFNIKGKEWTSTTGKKDFFNCLKIWRIKSWSQAGNRAAAPEFAPPVDLSSAPDEDDLPF